MADNHTKEIRSMNMSHIRSTNSKPEEIVLDLFAGSGTTIMAAEQNKRIAYCMEFDPKYADVIIDRWEKFTGKKAERIYRRDVEL